MNSYEIVLKEVLNMINPSKEDFKSINTFLKDFSNSFKKNADSLKIDLKIFVGGSFAKKTMIKKERYDVDLFIRFDEKYKGQDISDLTEKILKKSKEFGSKLLRIHGSRDYFKLDVTPSFFVEIIPVIKVKNAKEAENITDLSYFHVGYINKKLKTEKILEQVRLAKAFCHAKKCYGAESYINGFSGYALELLICYYGSFLKFVKSMPLIKEKQIIDIEKQYKNKTEVMMNMNSAKMASPIVLIDPTFRERNAIAALSEETFKIFQKACIKFLKNPSVKEFEKEKVDISKIKREAVKKSFIAIELETDKQEGDIAGTKLLKFYKHLNKEVEKYYLVHNSSFEYTGDKKGKGFFVLTNKKEILFDGPNKEDKKNITRFKKKHKKTFIKGDKVYAKEKFDTPIKDFLKEWKSVNCQKIIGMGITDIKLE